MTDKELRSSENPAVHEQAAKAARERQTRFRRISAITSDIGYSCHTRKDGSFSIDWMTGAADRITGYSVEEIKAHGCWRFLVVEEDIPLFEKNVIGLAGGSRGSCELRIRHKNGSVVWLSSFAECVAEAKIPARLLYGGLTDITERKYAQEKLSASETRYRRLFEAARDGILILEADTGMITDANVFLTEMLGFSREEFLGKHIWDLGFFKGIVANQGEFLKLQQKEYIRYEDVSLETADGQRINVEFVSNLYPVGQGKVIQCSIRRAHLASFPAQNPHPVVEVGTDGAVRFANPAAMTKLARLGLDADARQFLQGKPEELVLLRSHCERNPQTEELHVGEATFLRAVTAPPGGDSLHVYAIDITDRKQAEEALRQSEDRYRTLIQSVGEGIGSVDPEEQFAFANAAAEDIFGVPPGGLLGRSLREFTSPEQFGMIRERTDRRRTGERGIYEIEINRPSGEKRNLLVTAVPQFDRQGKFLGALGVFHDITERKQAEQKLRVSEFDLRQAQAMAHVGNWRWVIASDELVWSDEMCHIYGIAPQASTRSWRYVIAHAIHPEDRARVEEATEAVIADHHVQSLEYRIIRPDGSVRTVLDETGEVILDDKGLVTSLRGIVLDITERKQAEEALLQEKDDWESTFESLTDAVTIHDKNYDIVRANASARRMLGLPLSGNLTNAKCFTCFHGTEKPPEGCPSCRSLLTQQPSVSEFFEPHLNKYLEIRAIPRFDTDHQCVGLVHVVRDITERKRAEADKDVMQAQLRQSQKMETIGQLAGGVAHDFNNLLTGILGNIALVRSSLPSVDPLLENLNAAETAARQAATLTKGLLTFSRSAVVVPVSMNFTVALDVSLALLKQSLPSTMAIVRDDEQPAWNVMLDQTQMTQILLNLVVNARDAMQGKGTLTIRTTNATVDTAYVDEHPYARPGEFVHLSVTDTGPGMSSDAMQHLFEPFYTTKPAGSGTGLGLPIVYGAVKQAGGWIVAVSTKGVGVTFDIYLPRCLEEPKDSLTPGPVLVRGSGETILVVEDEPIVGSVARALLSRSGYTVLTAMDGVSALNVLREHLTDIRIILLDMTMPGMTTDEIVQAIRLLNPTVPILLNSGHSSNDTINLMLEKDTVQGFLGKPYTLGELVGKVQELLGRD